MRTYIGISALLSLFSLSSALPILPEGYSWSNDSYFSLDELSRAKIYSAQLTITFEEAAYESDFGIYAQNNPAYKLEIFRFDQEPLAQNKIFFDYDKDVDLWYASTMRDQTTNQLIAPVTIGQSFGYYCGVYNDIYKPPFVYWYSDKTLNAYADGRAVDQNFNHFSISTNDQSQSYIFLEDMPGSIYGDYNDMIIYSSGLVPIKKHDVPEPKSLPLFMIGLCALLFVCMRRYVVSKEAK